MLNKEGAANKVILWGVNVSPYVRKVMVALAEKNIPYKQIETLPKRFLQATGQPIPDGFEQVSPLGKIPALQIGAFSIADSAAIAGYLDQKFPHTKLLYPHNTPEEYAKVLWFEHYSDNILTDIGYKKIFFECVIKPKVFNQSTDDEIVKNAKENELPPLLDYLNQSVRSHQWIAGDEFSMADIAIATQFLALKMAGYEIDNNRWNNLSQYFKKVIARDSFSKII